MGVLDWVTTLLWDGVVGPSDRMWLIGAAALSEAGALPVQLAQNLPAGGVYSSGLTLLQLGREARAASEAEERTEILAEIWGTCAGCHVEAR